MSKRPASQRAPTGRRPAAPASKAVTVGPLTVRVPRTWQAESQATEDGTLVSLQSPGSTFGLFALYRPGAVDLVELAETALDSLREEHPGLESEELPDLSKEVAGAGYEATFFTLDVVATCWLRAFPAGGRVAFAMVQTAAGETDDAEAVFHALCRSALASAGDAGESTDADAPDAVPADAAADG